MKTISKFKHLFLLLGLAMGLAAHARKDLPRAHALMARSIERALSAADRPG